MTTRPFTLLDAESASDIEASLDGSLAVSAVTLESATGWTVKPEGFCRNEVCVPAGDAVGPDGAVDLAAFARLTGRPLIVDEQEKVISLGASSQGRASDLGSLDAPNFTLPDLDGKMHSLSDYRGKKILLAVYASW